MVVGPAPLPGRSGQHRGDRVAQALVAVGGDQGHAGQAAGDQAPEERQPPGAVLGAGHVDTEDLPLAAGVDAGGDQGVHVHRAAALADLLGECVQPHEGVRPGVQRPGPEAVHQLVEFGGHEADLRLRQRGHTERGGQLLHPPGGDTQQVAGRHHRGQRPLGAPPVLEELRVVRALAQLGDRQLDGPGPGIPLALPVTVAAVTRPGVTSP